MELRPGKPGMTLLSGAVWSVDRTGLNRAAWLKATCWDAVTSKWAALAIWRVGSIVGPVVATAAVVW